MADATERLQAKAKAHQDAIDRDTRFFDVGTLAKRWGVSPNTVRAIPAASLPFLNVGSGLQRERRRYHPADVIAYEGQRLPKAS